MELIPSQAEVSSVLERTGALRRGHFTHPSGTHSDLYLQMPLALRHFSEAKMLTVALSRKLRQNDAVRRALPAVSIAAPAVGGLPVAFGVAEALRASQTWWAENDGDGRFGLRQFCDIHPGERVILVDDILRTGNKLSQLRALVENAGATVLALAVLVRQPFENCAQFPGLPLMQLLTLAPRYWPPQQCPLCSQGVPSVAVFV